MRSVPDLERILGGEPLALGTAITLAEREDPRAADLLSRVKARTGRAFRVGVTGPPGVGKSSLLREIVRRLRAKGERAAIVASDPVSPFSGGALLGDRFRLAALGQDRGLFFRSLAHRAAPGESGRVAAIAADILDAGGYPWIFLETVGTGQADVGVFHGTHLGILVHSPDQGDELQMMKAGILEAAGLHVVTRSDRPGAASWAARLLDTLRLGAGQREPSVIEASAVTGDGVDRVVEELEERRREFVKTGRAVERMET